MKKGGLLEGKKQATETAHGSSPLVNAAIVLSVATGALYCLGYSSSSGYLAAFGVNISLMSYTYEEIMYSGFLLLRNAIFSQAVPYNFVHLLAIIVSFQLLFSLPKRRLRFAALAIAILIAFSMLLSAGYDSAKKLGDELKMCRRPNTSIKCHFNNVFQAEVETESTKGALAIIEGYEVAASSSQLVLYDSAHDSAEVVPIKKIRRVTKRGVSPFELYNINWPHYLSTLTNKLIVVCLKILKAILILTYELLKLIVIFIVGLPIYLLRMLFSLFQLTS